MKQMMLLLVLVSVTSCSYFKQQVSGSKTVNGMTLETVTLPNQLEVLLVHDIRFKKSSAAMAVHVGSMDDPDNSQGLAHYLEHMLFLGTKEFPKSDEYSTYMETNGGWDNAYTADEVTNYMFEVDNGALEGGLHRFSRFFVSPIFDETYVQREKNAVNSEFEKNIKQDNWRMDRFTSMFAKPGHSAGKFSTGNTKTLEKVSRGDVINFYRKYYSSNNMKLVIMSAKPMNELKTWTQKYFSDVPNFNVQRPTHDDFWFNPDAKNRLHFVKSIENTEEMSVMFNIPDSNPFWASKPTLILARLIGDEGKGSLLSYLKSQGWALNLSAGQGAWRVFAVNVTLTPSGRTHHKEVTTAIFQYIDLMKRKGYPQYVYEDEKSLRRIDFENLEPSSSGNRAAWFAAEMIDYPVDEFLERNFFLTSYSKEDFDKFLSYLKVDNSHVIISSNTEKTTQKEDIFGVEYADAPLVLNDIDVSGNFVYPEKNKYIPDNFSLVSADRKIGEPKRIDVGDKGEVFFQQDTDLGLVKGFAHAVIISEVPSTPENFVLNALFALSKGEELREWAYPIGEARFNFSIQTLSGDAVTVSVTGYTQRLMSVFKDLIVDTPNGRRLDQVKIDEKLFKDIKERYKKDLLNEDEEVAAQRLNGELQTLIDTRGIRWQELLPLIDKVQLKDIQDFAKRFYAKISVRMVVYGNFKEEDFTKFPEFIFASLPPAAPLSKDIVESKRQKFRIVPDAKNYSMLVKGKNNNHAMLALYKLSDWNVEDHAKAIIVDQVLSQPYFSELRTNQQLGYVARAGAFTQAGFVGLSAIIQSGKHNSRELYEKSDKFLGEFLKKKSESMTDEEIKPVKAALLNELLTRPNTLYERYAQFSNAALKYDGRFKIREEIAEQVKAASADSVKGFIKDKFLERRPANLTLYYSGQGSKLNKKDLPGVAFEKAADIKDWTIGNPYLPQTTKN